MTRAHHASITALVLLLRDRRRLRFKEITRRLEIDFGIETSCRLVRTRYRWATQGLEDREVTKNRAAPLQTDEARAKSVAANTAAWADEDARAVRIAAMRRSKKARPVVLSRAIGTVGTGDMQKLADAGLTVVDTQAYAALVETLRAEVEGLRARVRELEAKGSTTVS